MKTCKSCGVEKPGSEYYGKRTARDGLASRCKPCYKAQVLAYQRSHYESRRAWEREWSKRPEQMEHSRHQGREYHRRNPEKCRARKAVYKAKRRKKNPLVPGPCVVCGAREDIEAHHHKGYDRKHWLEVEWRCREHHRK